MPITRKIYLFGQQELMAVIDRLVEENIRFSVEPAVWHGRPDKYAILVNDDDQDALLQTMDDPSWQVLSLRSSEIEQYTGRSQGLLPDYELVAEHINEALCDSVLWQTVADVVDELKSNGMLWTDKYITKKAI